MQHYCIDCGIAGGWLKPAVPANLFHTPYQLGKYVKHTRVASLGGFNSVFWDPSTATYRSNMVNAVSSGHVQVDSWGRVNIIWPASYANGSFYENGGFCFNEDAVKVILHDNPLKIHAYPTLSSEILGQSCRTCGRVIN